MGSDSHGTTLTLEAEMAMVRSPDGAQRNPGIGIGGGDCFPRNALRSFRATYFAFVWRGYRIFCQWRLR
jgi:hypothetical protein